MPAHGGQGARVAVVDWSPSAPKRSRPTIDGIAYVVDVTDFDALDAAAQRRSTIARRHLRCSSTTRAAARCAAIHEWELAEWQRIVTLNLTGVFHGFKAVAPLILESGGGAIVSTASISGTRPAAGEAPYAAAKAAVAALTASAALEYAPTIRVNAVSPGMIATPR